MHNLYNKITKRSFQFLCQKSIPDHSTRSQVISVTNPGCLNVWWIIGVINLTQNVQSNDARQTGRLDNVISHAKANRIEHCLQQFRVLRVHKETIFFLYRCTFYQLIQSVPEAHFEFQHMLWRWIFAVKYRLVLNYVGNYKNVYFDTIILRQCCHMRDSLMCFRAFSIVHVQKTIRNRKKNVKFLGFQL